MSVYAATSSIYHYVILTSSGCIDPLYPKLAPGLQCDSAELSSGFIRAVVTAMPETIRGKFTAKFEAVAFHKSMGTVVKIALRIYAIDKE